jgi:hypothetical protein
MKCLTLASLLVVVMVCSVGCGDSAGPAAPATNQDELSQWVKDNPAPPETPVD